MYLKRVEIQGFKSFADPVTIDFKDGITCIIGPNGSGKSNISDAMRWVLGEQSAKTLRGGKMEEVIFAGTASRRQKGMAEVAIVFDNSTGILPIEYNEVSIMRRLFRSGESEYSINGNQCRLRDIRELIMDTGIGVDGYSFIGQGRVEKIESDKDARREVFEEAAGIIKYKSQKAEAGRKLDAAHNNLDRMNDIIIDIESRIGGLQTESEKAKEHAVLSEKHRAFEINITLKNIETFQEKNRELQAQFAQSGDALDKARAEKSAVDAKLSVLRRKNEEMETAGVAIREAIAENVNRTLATQNRALLSEERRRSIEKDKQRLETESETLRARIEAEEVRAQEIFAVKSGSDAKLAALTKELEDKMQVHADRSASVTAVLSAIEEGRNVVFELSRERAQKEAELTGNLDLMGSFDLTKTRIEDEIALAETEAAAAAAQIETASDAKRVTAEKLAAATEKETTLRGEYEKITADTSEERAAIERIGLQKEQLSSRKKTIEEMENNYEGYNSGIRQVMKAGIPGIEGVVTELIDVPKGYESAIETALGATLQNLICKDDEAAKKAIRWLKENKAGRLTFLPVSSIRPNLLPDAKEIEQHKGFDAYALDRVGFDEKYRNIFEYLLGRVVIADNLNNAVLMSRVNREGYRIVTLDGDIINPAGALTGGAYRNKSANLLERRSEIAALAENIARLEKEKEKRLDLLEDLAVRGSTCTAALQIASKEIRESESLLAQISGELKTHEYRRDEITERIEKRRRELSNIAEDKDRSLGMNDGLRLDIERIGNEILRREAQAETDAARYEAEKQKSAAAGEAVTEVRLAAATATAEKANNDEKANEVAALIQNLKTELESKSKELTAVLTEENPARANADPQETVRQLEEEKAEFEVELEKITSDRQETRRQIEESELRQSDLAAAIDRQVASKNAMEVEIGRQETRIAGWKDKLFDDFDLSYVHALEFREEGFVMSSAIRDNRAIKERLFEIGEVNPGSIKEYEETSERYNFLTAQRDDILKSMEDYQKIVTDMDRISKAKFKDTFNAVVKNFDETFRLLFGGGKGELQLEDENDPLETEIIINVQIPGKANLASIDSYSGGERTMIAIALMFAILKAKPAPFCILDEVDAPLDETNIHRFADYVMGFRETQFALVTHQRSTMEYADALFGVTMQEQGVTTILSLMLGEKETAEFADKLEN
ncbi:MAG: chromosome segregation protein SMC [Clostridiales Family XIII bacterium]|jgi:chromosome segregation protein|nr:chromosome segregation protein SMC [Clostridiales Family XIII bacterium]